MSFNLIKQKLSLVDTTQNPFDEKKIFPEPEIVIVTAYTLIAILYCVSSTVLFYHVVENIFPASVKLLLFLSIVIEYLILLQTIFYKWSK
jgi:hypothetical protein